MSTELNKRIGILRACETCHPKFLAAVNLFCQLHFLMIGILGQVSKQLAEID